MNQWMNTQMWLYRTHPLTTQTQTVNPDTPRRKISNWHLTESKVSCQCSRLSTVSVLQTQSLSLVPSVAADLHQQPAIPMPTSHVDPTNCLLLTSVLLPVVLFQTPTLSSTPCWCRVLSHQGNNRLKPDPYLFSCPWDPMSLFHIPSSVAGKLLWSLLSDHNPNRSQKPPPPISFSQHFPISLPPKPESSSCEHTRWAGQ